METYCTMHRMHCSSACLLKLHCENGVLKRITSAGDIPAGNSYEADEALFPPQRRACIRGYSEIEHLNSPFRMTEPLLQTGPRGDRFSFRPVSWKEAIDRTADFYYRMRREAEITGYLPVLEKAGVGRYLGRTLGTFGNSSSGFADGAIYAAIGDKKTIKGHPPVDVFNTNYLVIWANNPAETLPYLSFLLIRAKEKGIPVTVVDSRFTDSAAAYGSPREDIPSFVCPRPGTDGALLTAMAYVIFRQGLLDENYIKEYCFGFYPGETVVSRSCGKDPVTGEPFAGKTYRVPEGESFLEYLEETEREHGGYRGVLEWCARVTGVPADTAEKFALAYGRARPAFLFSRYNGGAQRSFNGLHYCWMLIALSAMTGNLTRRGGGFGEICGDDVNRFLFPGEKDPVDAKPYPQILISQYTTEKLILTGRDGRTAEQLRSDVLAMNGLDLGEDAKLSLKGIVKGAKNGNPMNQLPGINLRRYAWEKLSFIMTYEREFSPMAAMCDLILPSAGQYESGDRLFQHRFGGSDTYHHKGLFQPPGEARTDRDIQRMIAEALGLPVIPEEEYRDLAEKQWEKARVPEGTLRHYPDYRKPSFETLVREGIVQLPERPEDTEPVVCGFRAGCFPTETGRINFYSPFLARRDRITKGPARACYVPLEEGAEDIGKEGLTGRKGLKYTLQLIAPHTIVKADATFDNVSLLRAFRPNRISLHPEEADRRGLKEGQTAYLYNDYGCIRLPVHRTASIPKGVAAVPHGAWYAPDESERYLACYDADGDGSPEFHDTAVDAGGNTNTVTCGKCGGVMDPFIVGMGLNSNGHACEVSAENPDRIRRPGDR